MQRRVRRQPRIRGGRDPLFSCVLPVTKDAIVNIANRAGVSPSWVVATVLADFVGGTARQRQPDYRVAGGKK